MLNGDQPNFRYYQSRNPITMPLEPLKRSQMNTTQERVFLEAVERGDKPTVIRCLQDPYPVNVNCTNMLGRSAIQIAVDNENVELVEILLKQEGVKIGDALLYAITEGVYKIVEMLIDHPSITLEMLGPDWSKSQRRGEESSDYSSDISPIILAAHCNQFEILQLILLRGANIKFPHMLSCSCQECQEQVNEDSLRHSLFRINSYKALASPAWISLTSPDPILTAFKLSWELQKLALTENEFKDTYIQLSDQCKKYACDLMDQCRSSEEVTAVLNRCSDTEEEEEEEEGNCAPLPEKLTLSRLKLALKYEQKQFVSHPHCQQLLTSIWYEGLPGWRKRNGLTKFLLCMGLILIGPFMAVYYLIFPRSKIGQLLRSPFMKFLYHSASFGVFLILLVLCSTDISSPSDRGNIRGPPPSELEWLIFLWVMGFVWAECKQLWEEGLKAYTRQWWNWLDFLMLSLYIATFSLRLVAYVQIESGKYGDRNIPRKDWPIIDPTLLAEGLFAVANVFSFSRIIFLAQANQHLGPLQISLGCMLIDIGKFLFIFFLVLTSFACGMTQLYWYYYNSRVPEDPVAFVSLGESYATLYWSLFGITTKHDLRIQNGQNFTEMLGRLMFMLYHCMAIIVLINMLIAMMSNSFQNIENHADMEWKFSRSKLWMGYFDEGSTLPSPFNLIISPKSIYYAICFVKDLLSSCVKDKQHFRRPKRRTSVGSVKPVPNPVPRREFMDINSKGAVQISTRINIHSEKPPAEVKYRPPLSAQTSVRSNDEMHYQDIMRRLVSRYIHQFKKDKQLDGVNEDDLLEIKQDISSLRYELREDRKRESYQAANLLQSTKQEIISLIQKFNMTIHPLQTGAGQSQSPLNVSTDRGQTNDRGQVLSSNDLEQLKEDIISGICSRLHDNIQTLQGMERLPSIDSDLYTTHLYTQL
ncbi:transient-receptor-potential-like protein [Saccostrea echinata]|uniref:transient-receptor-potential-like protein n=1 Tax=Saccostrea echinata TaxID=191078 RepID=UPI002A82B4BE|nr:transient-receptor-potential-like protein [Saccostrea echinata]